MNFDPDVIEIAPERSKLDEGHIRLIAAVMHRGIVDYANAKCKWEPHRLRASEIWHWLWDDDNDGPGSILWCCQCLGYPVSLIRTVTVAKAPQIVEMEKTGRNFLDECFTDDKMEP